MNLIKLPYHFTCWCSIISSSTRRPPSPSSKEPGAFLRHCREVCTFALILSIKLNPCPPYFVRYSVLLCFFFQKSFGSKMSVFSTRTIMQLQEFPEWSPSLVTLGEDLPVGLVTGVSGVLYEHGESRKFSSLGRLFLMSLQYSPSVHFQLQWTQPWWEMALRWCRLNTVRAKSSETRPGVKLLYNSLWSIRQGKKEGKFNEVHIHLEEFPTPRLVYENKVCMHNGD